MRWTRVWIFIPLMSVALLSASCSYSTDFVVVNESDQAIEVLYKVKKFPVPLASLDPPATTDVSKLSPKGNHNWAGLASTHYQLDEVNRTVTVWLEAGKALRVTTMFHYFGHNDPQDAANYPIEYITMTGASGSTTFAGDQARVGFTEVSRVLYTLTYR